MFSEQNNFDFLDMLEIMAFIIQVMDYDATIKQVGNNDLMEEMRRQDSEYLQKIIGQNNEIIEQNKAILRALEGQNV